MLHKILFLLYNATKNIPRIMRIYICNRLSIKLPYFFLFIKDEQYINRNSSLIKYDFFGRYNICLLFDLNSNYKLRYADNEYI